MVVHIISITTSLKHRYERHSFLLILISPNPTAMWWNNQALLRQRLNILSMRFQGATLLGLILQTAEQLINL